MEPSQVEINMNINESHRAEIRKMYMTEQLFQGIKNGLIYYQTSKGKEVKYKVSNPMFSSIDVLDFDLESGDFEVELKKYFMSMTKEGTFNPNVLADVIENMNNGVKKFDIPVQGNIRLNFERI